MLARRLAAVILCSCGRIGFDASSSSTSTGDAGSDAFVDTNDAPLGSFGTPMRTSTLNAVGAIDGDPDVTGDGLELFFKSDRGNAMYAYDLYTSVRATPSDPWLAPVPITELNTTNVETSPCVSYDGLTLWFTSNRPGGSGLKDLWVTTRPSRGASWSVPQPLSQLNSAQDDEGVVVDNTTLVMMFHSSRPGVGGSDLYATTRVSPSAAWSSPTRIAELATASSEQNPFLSPNNRQLFFNSDQPGGLGGHDLWVATRAVDSDPFSPPTLVVELSSPATIDADPWLADDLRHVLFTSNRSGDYDIYEATR